MPVACEKPAVVNGFISFHIATKGIIFHKGLSRYFTFGNRRIFHLIVVPSFLAVRYKQSKAPSERAVLLFCMSKERLNIQPVS